MGIRRDVRVAERRRDVAALYLRGMTQAEIAHKHRVSQSQISLDLKCIHAAWTQAAVMDFNEAKARELARIDALEREYWSAWERSQKEKSRTTTSRATGKSAYEKAEMQKEQLLGDPRFLDGILRCIEQRLKIFGVYAPQKWAPTDPTGQNEWTGKSDSELVAEFRQLVDAARARAGTVNTGGTGESGKP